MKKPPETIADLVRDFVERALWDIGYHEGELAKDYKKAAAARALIARGDFGTVQECVDLHAREGDDEPDGLETPRDYIQYWLGDCLDCSWHENQMRDAYARLAAGSALLQRTGLDREISIDELKAEVRKRLDE